MKGVACGSSSSTKFIIFQICCPDPGIPAACTAVRQAPSNGIQDRSGSLVKRRLPKVRGRPLHSRCACPRQQLPPYIPRTVGWPLPATKRQASSVQAQFFATRKFSMHRFKLSSDQLHELSSKCTTNHDAEALGTLQKFVYICSPTASG